MTDHSTGIVTPAARWSFRLALFSAALLLAGLVLHRLASLSTPLAQPVRGATPWRRWLLLALVALAASGARLRGAGSAASGSLPVLTLADRLAF
jgi:hypothetical protein